MKLKSVFEKAILKVNKSLESTLKKSSLSKRVLVFKFRYNYTSIHWTKINLNKIQWNTLLKAKEINIEYNKKNSKQGIIACIITLKNIKITSRSKYLQFSPFFII